MVRLVAGERETRVQSEAVPTAHRWIFYREDSADPRHDVAVFVAERGIGDLQTETQSIKPHGGPVGSRDADIDFTFTRPTTVRALLDALTTMGWSAVTPVGHVAYMVNDEDDSYEWHDSTPEHIGEALAVLDARAHLPYTVALDVYHSEAKTGGMLMFHAGRTVVSFVPGIDRRRVPAAPEFTDVAWYLQALLPALVTAGLRGYEAREVCY